MTTHADWIRESPDGVLLTLHVQPRASRVELCGVGEQGVRIRLTAPPVDDAANRQCREFFAHLAGVPKSSVEIVRGGASRHKTILIRGSDAKTLRGLINQREGG